MDKHSLMIVKTGKIEILYSKTVYLAAALFFGYIVFRMFVPMIKSTTGVNGLKLMAALLPCVISLWIVLQFLSKHMDIKTCSTAVVFLIVINLTLQVICLIDLRVSPSWDFGAIMKAADDISAGRSISYITYFQEYPYNLNTSVLVGTFKYLVGGSVWAPYVLNILAVTSSVVGACLLARRAFGPAVSVITGLFCVAATPLYLYIPIVYTDTLSMPFAIWTLYVWSLAPRKAGWVRLLCLYALIGLLSAMGYLIKPIAAIGLVAFVMECLLGRQTKPFLLSHDATNVTNRTVPALAFAVHRLLPVAVVVATALLAIVTFHYYMDFKGYTSRIDYNKSIPFTHWLMMGMNESTTEGGSSFGYGGFSAYDLTFTRSYPSKLERQQADLQVIKERLRIFGVKGYVRFLLRKAEWTWTDGTYFAPVKLARRPLKLARLHVFVLSNKGLSSKLYRGYSRITQLLLLLLILIGCIFGLAGKNSEIYRAMVLMCLGIMVFLLFWEARSRYLVNMIPVFIVMAAASSEMTYRFIAELKIRERLHGNPP